MHEIIINTNGVAKIDFVGYDDLMRDAQMLADAMRNTTVTEENVRENKKLLATVRKRIKAMDEERIKVKNTIMTPYDELNEKIIALKEVLAEGEQHIDSQVKELTYKQQAERTAQIEELFIKYQASYNAPLWLTFERFLAGNKSLVTNKATSAKTIRASIIDYFEHFKSDYAELKKQVPVKQERSAILLSYQRNGFNMNQAIADYREMIAERERLEKEQQRVKQSKVPDIVILNGNEKPIEKIDLDYVNIRVREDVLERMKELGLDYEILM